MRIAPQTLAQQTVRRAAQVERTALSAAATKASAVAQAEVRSAASIGVKERLADAGSATLIWLGDRSPGLTEVGHKVYGYMTRSLDGPPLQKVGKLSESLLRGAQPTEAGFAELAQQGVKTVINLRPENNVEKDLVEKLGMKAVFLPLPPLDAPTHADTLAFLKTALDPANGKVFFHCYHGVDRTGTMAAAVRIARDGWSADQAIAELRSFGFHEGGQKAKLRYIQEFETFWQGLPAAQKADVLHQPLESLKPRLKTPLTA
ncbi:MAG TPA: sulfur transferase domain-containing protein [Stenomitos sp.]